MTDSDKIFVFGECQNIKLVESIQPSARDPGLYDQNSDLPGSFSIPADTWVSSHYLHYDPEGLFSHSRTGSVTFDTPVMGVIERPGELDDSDEGLSCTNTDYPRAFTSRGFELGEGDWFQISDDLRTVSVRVDTAVGLDNARVLTVGFPNGKADCCVDTVYVFDSSDSSSAERTLFCSRRWQIDRQIWAKGVDQRFDAYRIGKADVDPGDCTQTVVDEFGVSVPGTSTSALDQCLESNVDGTHESWAAAVAIVAERYPWRNGCRRLIIPVTDESAYCGDPNDPLSSGPTDSADVVNAVEIANQHYGIVSPIVGSAEPGSGVEDQAHEIADKTGGRVGHSSGFESDVINSVTSACSAPVYCSAKKPIAHYRFEPASGIGLDSSGFGRNGGIGAATSASGYLDSGLQTKPTNDALEFQVPHDSQLDSVASFSAMAWIKPTGLHTSDNLPNNCTEGTILTKGGNYWFQLDQNSTQLVFQNEPSGASGTLAVSDPPFKISLKNRWTHVAFSRLGWEELGLYVNGQPLSVSGGLLPPGHNTTAVTVGHSDPSACEFNGVIDELRLYDCALRPDQVREVFLSEKKPVKPFDPVVRTGSHAFAAPMRDILAACGLQPHISYSEQGSGAAGSALIAGTQQIAPMARFLTASECNAGGNQGSGVLLGLDAITVVGAGSVATTCNTLRYSDSGQTPLPSGYIVSDWRDVLRVVYTGQTTKVSLDPCSPSVPAITPSVPGSIAARCSSAVRQALLANWGAMFEGGCVDGTCSNGLRHAWRSSDTSDMTEIFLSLLGLPPATTRTFCNGFDNEDLDPIRRPCDANEQVCSNTRYQFRNASPEGGPPPAAAKGLTGPTDVGDLGVVLAIKMPADPSKQYPALCPAPIGGTFRRAPMPFAITNEQKRCPDGLAPKLGCLWPVHGATGRFCLARKGNVPGLKHPDFQFMDGRGYNQVPRDPDTGAILLPSSVAQIPDQRWGGGGFYRIHQTAAMAGGSGTCLHSDPTAQVGCLVQADPCSMGYTTPGGLGANVKAFNLGSPLGPPVAVAPTIANIRKLLDPTGPSCGNGIGDDFGYRYPLAFELYLNSSLGLENVSDVTYDSDGNQVESMDLALLACLAERGNGITDTAITDHGLVTLPASASYPQRQCP